MTDAAPGYCILCKFRANRHYSYRSEYDPRCNVCGLRAEIEATRERIEVLQSRLVEALKRSPDRRT